MSLQEDVVFLSAADRWNLGDLLFPMVFKHFADARTLGFMNVGLVNYSPDDPDILPVKSVLDLKPAKYELVIGGGEVLNADLLTLLGYISPTQIENFWIKILLSCYHKIVRSRPTQLLPLHLRILRKTIVFFLNKKYGIWSYNSVPFFMTVLLSSRRFYFPVGGVYSPDIEASLSSSYKNTLMFAARDKRTRDSFSQASQQCVLVPDPVSTIAEIFPWDGQKKKQVVIQFTKSKLPFGLNRLVGILNLFHQKGYSVIGLALARCLGHDDINSLEELQSMWPSLKVITKSSVQEAMDILASSEVYMGTSLHGAIISHSYGNAVIGMDEAVIKLSDYLNTWMPKFSYHLSASTLDSEIFAFLDDFNFAKAKLNADRLSDLARSYIIEVLDNIEEVQFQARDVRLDGFPGQA